MEPSGPSPRADPRRALPPGAAALSSRGFALVLGAAFWLVGWPSGGGALAEQKAEGPGRRSAPEDARAELLKINYIFNRQLYEIAIPRYLKLLEAHPDFEDRAMVHHALALCYHSLARPSGAEAEEAASDPRRREHLESAVRHAKLCLAEKGFARRAEALDVLARDLLELGRSDEAARAFETLAAETEGEAKLSARLGLGEALYRRGDYPAAAKTFREIIASLGAAGAESSGGEAAGRAESRERASYHLALALYRQGGDAAREARDLFGKIAASGGALREDSTYMSALCEQSLGNQAAALEGYERLLGAGSRRWQEAALFGAGAARFHLEQYEACASSLETLLQKHPSTRYGDQARLYLGRALMKTGNLRSGAILLNELRRSAEVGAEASLWLARAYSSVGKHSQAIKIVEAAIGKFPSSPHREILELELAIELVADRRFDTALEVLARFSERGERSPHRDHAAYLEGFALHQAGDRKASLEVCRRFLSEHAASPYLRQVRQLEAENLFLTGGYAEAAELYRRYLDEFAADLAAEERLLASYRIGEARFFEGAHEDAIRILDAIAGGDLARDLEKALAGNPLFASYRYLLGEASYRLEDYRRAARELEAYLDAHPDGSHASDARFKRAHALHLAGETEAAAAAYREAVEAEPRSPHRLQIHFELAQLALEAGDRAAARESFREVVAADPASPLAPHACHYLGWIAHQESRPEEAVQWFRKLVDGYPQHERHAEALYLLALNLQALKRLDEASEVIARLRKDHPDDPSLLRLRLGEGIAFSREGRPEEALKIFAALETEQLPAETAALLAYEQAWCHRALEQPDEAAECYRRLLAIEPGGADPDRARELALTARLELAELELERGRPAPAREILGPLARDAAEPLREKALYRLCWCHYREGNAAALEASYAAYTDRYGSGERALEIAILLARGHIQAKRIDDAAKVFESIAARGPSTPQAELALVSLGECLNEQRQFDAALERFTEFLKRYPSSRHAERAHFGLGWAEESLRRPAAALPHYRRAVGSGSPVSARAQFQIGQCLAAEEKYEDAIVEFLQVEARHRDAEWSCRALLQVAGCFEKLDDPAKARAYYSEVIEKFPERDEARLAAERRQRLPE